MNVGKFSWLKWVLYVFLFVLTATLSLFFFTLIYIFSAIFWIFVPSPLIYLVTVLIPLCVSLFFILLARRKRRYWLTAISLGIGVVPGLMVVLTLLSFFIETNQSQKPNQKQPVLSPSGKYVLTVPIKRSAQTKGPFGFGLPFWQVTISDANKRVIYRDQGESFHGIHNVYWIWDEQDRVWLFNSDDGGVYFFECVDGEWHKATWDSGEGRNITPPPTLYPEYVTRRPATGGQHKIHQDSVR